MFCLMKRETCDYAEHHGGRISELPGRIRFERNPNSPAPQCVRNVSHSSFIAVVAPAVTAAPAAARAQSGCESSIQLPGSSPAPSIMLPRKIRGTLGSSFKGSPQACETDDSVVATVLLRDWWCLMDKGHDLN
jgi:hypothetical protein